jgi:hypothetical protein
MGLFNLLRIDKEPLLHINSSLDPSLPILSGLPYFDGSNMKNLKVLFAVQNTYLTSNHNLGLCQYDIGRGS